MPDTIDVTPTFRDSATILLALLENGTPEGRAHARAEFIRWGKILDDIKAGRLNTHKKDA